MSGASITEPGIYAMDAATYHADPCRPMSLSSTGARLLSGECPAMFLHARQQPVRKRAFDVGTAGHLMVLEPDLFEQQVVVVRGKTKDGRPSNGYQSADAIEQREAAYASGKTPLLPEEVEQVQAMRDAVWQDPIARLAFKDGATEQSLFWRDPEFGIWCRTRPDYFPRHGRRLVDYKTSTSANPRDFERRVHDLGYHQQAAHYLDGYEAVTGERPDSFIFIVQAKTAPYLVSTCILDAVAIEIGRTINRYAKGVFAHCLATDEWPSYRPDVAQRPRAFVVGLPAYAINQHEARVEAGDYEPPALPDRKAA